MKLLIQNIKNFIKKEKISYLLVFLFFVSLFSAIYFSVPKIISLDDPLFYIKYSQMIRDNGFSVINNFHWIYFADNTRFGMLYSLFNFILIPFTYFPVLWLGIKFFAVIAGSLVMFLIYWWLKKLKIIYPFFILLFLWAIAPDSFVFRILYTRPFVIMMMIVLLEIYCLWKKKYLLILLLAFLHIFDHGNTFYLPIFFALTFLVFEYLHTRKFDYKLLIASVFGTLFGMMILPNFPQNFFIMFKVVFNIYEAVLKKSEVFIGVGAENYGINILDFIYKNYIFIGVLIAILLLRIIYYIYQIKLKSTENERLNFFNLDKNLLILNDVLFFINLISFLGFIFTRRVSDFWLPLLFIYIVLNFKILYPLFKVNIDEKYKLIIAKASKIILIILIFYLTVARAMNFNFIIAKASSPEILKDSAEWLNSNTKEGEIIFLDNWSYFPNLFYYNTKNYYIMGMEPRFLYDYDEELYLYWYNIVFKGFPCNQVDCKIWSDRIENKDPEEAIKILDKDIALIIRDKFKSNYILTSGTGGNFYVILKKSEYFSEVYRDPEFKNFTIFKINSGKLDNNKL